MKTHPCRSFLSLGLIIASLALTGCVVSVGSRQTTTPPPPPVPPGPPAVVITDSAEAATFAEIDAASQLSMDNARMHALAQIADRPSLSAPIQVHLINVAYRTLSFENSKVHVLQKMIARPDFGDAARHAIVSQLGKLSFDNSKQALLSQINQRQAHSPTP